MRNYNVCHDKNLMSNSFRKTAVLKKKKNCKLKLYTTKDHTNKFWGP